MTVQAVCGRGLVSATPSPHKTIFIKSGQIRSATARCPKGQHLVTGGFQRTNFGADGGNYVTESRAISSRAWRVTGSAFLRSVAASSPRSPTACARSGRSSPRWRASGPGPGRSDRDRDDADLPRRGSG